MKRQVFFSCILGLIFHVLISTSSSALCGTLEAMSTTGVMDEGGTVPLQGDASGGDLVQLIWIGSDGQIDSPDSEGNPTDDDSLLGTTYIGYGYPFEPNSGKFGKNFDHDLLINGNIVYVRAFNNPTVVAGVTLYGDSETHVYNDVGGFDSHDFGTWQTDSLVVPVELSSFNAIAEAGRVLLKWTTRSETNNAGFNLFRSTTNDFSKATKINPKLIDGLYDSEIGKGYEYIDYLVEEGTLYYYWLEDVSIGGVKSYCGPVSAIPLAVPKDYALSQNHPNPFNPTTTVEFQLQADGRVRLSVYNITGQLVKQLIDKNLHAGTHEVVWDGLDSNGSPAPSGMYVYTIEVNDFTQSRKMMLTK